MPKAAPVENTFVEEPTSVEESATPVAADEDLQARIALRAYEIYCAEGQAEGCEVEHWLRAEAEICGESASE